MVNFQTIIFLISIALISLPSSTRSTSTCETRYCKGSPQIPIKFPFQMRDNANTVERSCGSPGFEVSCNNKSQPLINLPRSGDFVIKKISLKQLYVWVNDPDECLAKRFFQNDYINLVDSPYEMGLIGSADVSFLNCTRAVDSDLRIPCMSDDEGRYSVIVAMFEDAEVWSKYYNSSGCTYLGNGNVPIDGDYEDSRHLRNDLLHSDLLLRWPTPLCKDCRADQLCGLPSSDTDSDDGGAICYNTTLSGHGGNGNPRSVMQDNKVGRIAWGVAVIVFVSWILVSLCVGISNRANQVNRQRQQRRSTLESNTVRPAIGAGFDHRISITPLNEHASISPVINIEQCPKIQLGESGQLPKSVVDNVCSICLSEYEPKDTLRSMPQCNHYFHADCIDAWLKMNNATCPLCRKLPRDSVLVTHLP